MSSAHRKACGAMRTSIKAIQAFEAAARLGSFALAADELAVTPSAISHQVRLLEDATRRLALPPRPPLGDPDRHRTRLRRRGHRRLRAASMPPRGQPRASGGHDCPDDPFDAEHRHSVADASTADLRRTASGDRPAPAVLGQPDRPRAGHRRHRHPLQSRSAPGRGDHRAVPRGRDRADVLAAPRQRR